MSRKFEFSAEDLNAVRAFKNKPDDPRAKSAVNSLYWKTVSDCLKKQADSGRSQDLDFFHVREIIDFGILDRELLSPDSPFYNKIDHILTETDSDGRYFYFSSWLRHRYKTLLNFNKKDDFRVKIERQKTEIRRLNKEIQNLQNARKNLFKKAAGDSLTRRNLYNPASMNQLMDKFESLDVRDNMHEKILIRKNEIKQGKFLVPEERREHLKKEAELEKITSKSNGILQELGNTTMEENIRNINKKILGLFEDKINQNTQIDRLEKDLSRLTEETSSLSPMEIESMIEEEMSYIRNLVRLSANRLRTDSMSVLYGKAEAATRDAVKRIMERVDEFDPRLYKNTSVNIYGMPSVVIIPGYGNGLYDWKSNALVIPVMPYTTLEVSVLSAVVEYRIDVDEDKKMIFGYNQLKEYSGIKSMWALRDKFLKDYTTWMVQEYKGYKVLKKEVRQWFEYEIGPNRNEMIVPFQYAPFRMSHKEMSERMKECTEKTESGTCGDENVWFEMGIFLGQQGKWDKASNAFLKAWQLNENFSRALYNLAFSSMKLALKNDTAKYFNEFIKRNPSSWWSGIARDHLLKSR